MSRLAMTGTLFAKAAQAFATAVVTVEGSMIKLRVAAPAK